MSQAAADILQASRPAGELLSPEFTRQLDRLDVLTRKMLAGVMQGERRSKKRGQGVEFSDFRPYVAGDDLRFVDWNLYARLERLFLRLYMEEEDLLLSVLVDVSASMDYGEPRKLHYAKQIAAAIGYIGLTHQNRVSLYALGDELADVLPNLRGRRPVPLMLDFLHRQAAHGRGDLQLACRRFALRQAGKGVVVLISDFLDKGDLDAALRYLSDGRFDVYAVQILSPQELDPAKAGLMGDLKLQDAEDAQTTEVSINAALLQRYQAHLQEYLKRVKDACQRRGISHIMGDTSIPFDRLVLRHLRDKGMLG